ncbi:unnamed protein product [Ectocarpus sp. CCAP 1310/34]|nr:unnamed protein product [Ectocarpus sp. CCAP 1310/34]
MMRRAGRAGAMRARHVKVEGEEDSRSESDLDVDDARGLGQATPLVRMGTPAAPRNGMQGDEGGGPPSPSSGGGDFGGGDDPADNSSNSNDSSGPSDVSNNHDGGGSEPLSGDSGDESSGGTHLATTAATMTVTAARPSTPAAMTMAAARQATPVRTMVKEPPEEVSGQGFGRMHVAAYIESIIKRFNVTTTAPTPAVTGADLGPKRDDEPTVDESVREALGCLMWMVHTRPDIDLPLNKIQKVAHSPTDRIWQALLRVMSYLNATKDLSLTFVRGGNTVNGTTKTQRVPAQSSSEAEHLAAGEGVKEALHARAVLSFVAPETSGAKIKVLEDNKGALALVQNPFSSARSKHTDVRYHFFRELFKSGKITAEYVPKEEQHVGMLTKVLGKTKLEYHRKALMNLPE